ncbi:MAG: hypothetical protein M3332_08195 [Actinomycetota bacterium]|nr:hypothetical protein [Actinomycetota bacterium]
MADHPDSDTAGQAYTDRLATLEHPRWKLRRLLGERRVLDVGCGIGRLAALGEAGQRADAIAAT